MPMSVPTPSKECSISEHGNFTYRPYLAVISWSEGQIVIRLVSNCDSDENGTPWDSIVLTFKQAELVAR